MTDPLLARARQAAERAADVAAETIQGFLTRGDWSESRKEDASPVTEVDIATEHAIRKVLSDAFPEAAFYGEETGHGDGHGEGGSPGGGQGSDKGSGQGSGQGSGLCWLVDPIDGTKSFVRGMPYYSTQIALERDGELVVGVSNAPAFGTRMVAVAGEGVTIDGKTVRCSDVRELSEVFLSSGNLGSLARDADAWARYGKLVSSVARVRGYGDFAHYHQLCAGQADVVIESDLNILDIAALTVGVREAGGVITDRDGGAIGRGTRSVVAANSEELHGVVLAELRSGS